MASRTCLQRLLSITRLLCAQRRDRDGLHPLQPLNCRPLVQYDHLPLEQLSRTMSPVRLTKPESFAPFFLHSSLSFISMTFFMRLNKMVIKQQWCLTKVVPWPWLPRRTNCKQYFSYQSFGLMPSWAIWSIFSSFPCEKIILTQQQQQQQQRSHQQIWSKNLILLFVQKFQQIRCFSVASTDRI